MESVDWLNFIRANGGLLLLSTLQLLPSQTCNCGQPLGNLNDTTGGSLLFVKWLDLLIMLVVLMAQLNLEFLTTQHIQS